METSQAENAMRHTRQNAKNDDETVGSSSRLNRPADPRPCVGKIIKLYDELVGLVKVRLHETINLRTETRTRWLFIEPGIHSFFERVATPPLDERREGPTENHLSAVVLLLLEKLSKDDVSEGLLAMRITDAIDGQYGGFEWVVQLAMRDDTGYESNSVRSMTNWAGRQDLEPELEPPHTDISEGASPMSASDGDRTEDDGLGHESPPTHRVKRRRVSTGKEVSTRRSTADVSGGQVGSASGESSNQVDLERVAILANVRQIQSPGSHPEGSHAPILISDVSTRGPTLAQPTESKRHCPVSTCLKTFGRKDALDRHLQQQHGFHKRIIFCPLFIMVDGRLQICAYHVHSLELFFSPNGHFLQTHRMKPSLEQKRMLEKALEISWSFKLNDLYHVECKRCDSVFHLLDRNHSITHQWEKHTENRPDNAGVHHDDSPPPLDDSQDYQDSYKEFLKRVQICKDNKIETWSYMHKKDDTEDPDDNGDDQHGSSGRRNTSSSQGNNHANNARNSQNSNSGTGGARSGTGSGGHQNSRHQGRSETPADKQDSLGMVLFTPQTLPQTSSMKGIDLAPQSANITGPSFTMIRMLGRGSYGTVDEVACQGSKQTYARKIIAIQRISPSASPELSILSILRKIQHPHIIELVFAFTTHNSLSLIISPVAKYDLSIFLQMQSSRTVFDKATTGTAPIREWFVDLSSAVLHLHAHGIVHGDIKPKNILVSAQEVVYLSDFGSARHATYETQFRTSFIPAFTPKYCAPEFSVLSSTKNWGPAVDMFSLGGVFAELATVYTGHSVQAFENFRRLESGATDFKATIPKTHFWMDFICRGPISEYDYQYDRLQTIKNMLKHDPRSRPAAEEVFNFFRFAPSSSLKFSKLGSLCLRSWAMSESIFFMEGSRIPSLSSQETRSTYGMSNPDGSVEELLHTNSHSTKTQLREAYKIRKSFATGWYNGVWTFQEEIFVKDGRDHRSYAIEEFAPYQQAAKQQHRERLRELIAAVDSLIRENLTDSRQTSLPRKRSLNKESRSKLQLLLKNGVQEANHSLTQPTQNHKPGLDYHSPTFTGTTHAEA